MRRREFGAVFGAAALWSITGHAQQAGTPYRVSYLALLRGEDATLAKPFLQRLKELGYVEGQNLIWTYRSAEGAPERLSQLAAEMARAKPQVLVAGFGTLAAKAAQAATTTIPIVFTSVGDPVGAGLVSSLGHPGANVTGVTSQASDIAAKRLQILDDFLPGRRPLAVLLNPDTPFTALALKELRAAADASHQTVHVFEARTVDQVASGIAAAVDAGASSLLTLDDPFLLNVRRQIVEQVEAAKLPAIYGTRGFAEAGGLMSYGVDRSHMSRRAADYVDRILKGSRPAELPVEQPTAFEFVINLTAAKALGISIPSTLLARADEVIE